MTPAATATLTPFTIGLIVMFLVVVVAALFMMKSRFQNATSQFEKAESAAEAATPPLTDGPDKPAV